MKRNLKRLLILVRDTIKDKNIRFIGTCHTSSVLLEKKMISYNDWIEIKHFIEAYRPGIFSRHFCFFNSIPGQMILGRNNAFYWKKYKREPRIKWLNYHINKL